MSYLISGIQQVGIGVSNVDEAWTWYRRTFGMDIQVFREAAEAPLMTRYTGGEVRSRDAVLALNLNGGGGMEIWQYTSRTPVGADFSYRLGDLGLFAARIKARDVAKLHAELSASGTEHLSPLVSDPSGKMHFFLFDVNS